MTNGNGEVGSKLDPMTVLGSVSLIVSDLGLFYRVLSGVARF